jgi:hypothetical protein
VRKMHWRLVACVACRENLALLLNLGLDLTAPLALRDVEFTGWKIVVRHNKASLFIVITIFPKHLRLRPAYYQQPNPHRFAHSIPLHYPFHSQWWSHPSWRDFWDQEEHFSCGSILPHNELGNHLRVWSSFFKGQKKKLQVNGSVSYLRQELTW